METAKIRKFMSQLSDLDYRYLRIQMSLANDARNLVNDFNVSPERFCERIGINLSDYDSYMRGGYDYTIMHMASIQAFFMELKREKAELEAEKLTGIEK